MQNLFLAQTQQGKNAWWRYALGAAGIFVFWQVGTAFVLVAVGALDERSMPGFALGLASFAFLLLGTWLCNRLLHGRSVRSLTTPFARLSWTRMIAASALWVAISALASAVEAVLYPARYAFNGVSADFWPYLAIGLVLIPLQTTVYVAPSRQCGGRRGGLARLACALRRHGFLLSRVTLRWPCASGKRAGPVDQRAENRKTVVDAKRSPGRSTTLGKPGWLGESGKCCVSRHRPARRP